MCQIPVIANRQTHVPQAFEQAVVGKIEGRFLPQRGHGSIEHRHDQILIVVGHAGVKIADLLHCGTGCIGVTAQPGVQKRAEIRTKRWRDCPDSAEIQQDDTGRGRIIPVIGKVGVRLHRAKFEQFAQNEMDQLCSQTVAHRLGCIHQGVERLALHIAHREYLRCAQVRVELRQHERVRPFQQLAKPGQMLSFGAVVGLVVQLALGLGHQGGDVHAARQKARQTHQGGHVVDVAVDAGTHAGILHLDRQIPSVQRLRPVHLPDGCGCKRADIETCETFVPPGSPSGIQDALQLFWRHVSGVVAQRRKNSGQVGRQHKAGVHRQHLAQL